MNQPRLNQEIYIPTALYLGHGRDDFIGGRARVIQLKEGISGAEKTVFVKVEENPNCWYNWEFLRREQYRLKRKFGNQRAHSEPDLRTEFNE